MDFRFDLLSLGHVTLNLSVRSLYIEELEFGQYLCISKQALVLQAKNRFQSLFHDFIAALRVSSRGKTGGLTPPPTQDLGGGIIPPLIFSDTEISNAS